MILPYDIGTNIVARDMRIAIILIEAVVSGRKPLQLICSPSGFAKTSITLQRCKWHGIGVQKPGVKPPRNGYLIESRPTKAIAAVRSIYACMQIRAAMLLLDDPGPIARNEAVLDVLKTSFGVQRECILETAESTRNERYRLAGSQRYNPLILPPRFPTANLRMLWLSNTNFTDPVLLAKLGDHFAPLIARGLNPWWVDDDRAHDCHDLFLYVHHAATEKNLLRSMGYPYRISHRAVNFYVANCHRLLDLAPRRLELIAQAFATDIPAARDAELASMLAKDDLRPKLKLPTSWVTVPGGVLLWPDKPFKTGTRQPEREQQTAPEKTKPSGSDPPEPTPTARQSVPTGAGAAPTEPTPKTMSPARASDAPME
jgi:hypothetical protein